VYQHDDKHSWIKTATKYNRDIKSQDKISDVVENKILRPKAKASTVKTKAKAIGPEAKAEI